MKAITVLNPGKNSTLQIQDIDTPEPGDHEIQVKIEATALNRADLLQRQGKYPAPEGTSNILGLEMAGIVEKVGPGVTRWKPGDFVFSLLPGGGYAEFCVIHEEMAMPIPDNLSFEEAAAIPETFLTAYQALHWVGQLQPKETVLIHAAGSGVGTSAIQLSSHLSEARILATAGKDRKLETAQTLGADFTYNYKKVNFSDQIERDLGSNSVDLIIDFVGASYWNKNINVLAKDGRLVLLAILGGHKVKNMSLIPILQKRLSVRGTTLRSRSLEYKIKLTQEFSARTLDLFERDLLRPVIDSVHDWQDAEKAHQQMADNKNTGKIVLTGM
ncbi:NAD(P)H-quinone oxidoreductase [Aliifodinibius sp. S!AR15-10]|uniref:NAD(P)H-quinone oxidoreductase n=1 Tax=Aliifodinibius sp. S!AR15-10 TaxID=2950437 RepID=UPI00285F243F|nr:NAD(P)H-quinone oxidoreductase [Aliifodinibius sp. S!AR15-10]MDR8391736.1 NAD(P)H-quinone oxidoreductase [Aliifodinibius sp. S!AR15-10]